MLDTICEENISKKNCKNKSIIHITKLMMIIEYANFFHKKFDDNNQENLLRYELEIISHYL